MLGAAEAELERSALQWDPTELLEHAHTVEIAGSVAGERLDELRASGRRGDPRRLVA